MSLVISVDASRPQTKEDCGYDGDRRWLFGNVFGRRKAIAARITNYIRRNPNIQKRTSICVDARLCFCEFDKSRWCLSLQSWQVSGPGATLRSNPQSIASQAIGTVVPASASGLPPFPAPEGHEPPTSSANYATKHPWLVLSPRKTSAPVAPCSEDQSVVQSGVGMSTLAHVSAFGDHVL